MRHGAAHSVLYLTLSAGPLLAGEEPDTFARQSSMHASAAAPLPAPFSEDSWTLQLTGNYLADLTNRNLALAGGSMGANYYFHDGISLGIEGGGYNLREPGVDGAAGNLGLMLRQHLIRRERWSLYVDVGESLLEADHDAPRGGTHFNFLFHTGPGITWKLTEHLHLMAGVRYYHISNAQTQGGDRNPASNGIEGYIGVMLPL